MDPNRKYWNEQHKSLRQALAGADTHQQAIELFLEVHAMVHAAKMAASSLHSFADEVWQDAEEAIIRRIPQNHEHSVAWVMWHVARIEDVTMNMLVAGSPQLLHQDEWPAQMGVPYTHTGNEMNAEDVAALSEHINLDALRAYRLAVGRRTRAMVQQLPPAAVSQPVDPERLQQVLDEGAVVPAADGLIDYWSRRDIAGLLLMPPTRHNFLHINEALRLKKGRSED